MNNKIVVQRSFRDDLQKNLIGSPTLKDLLTNNAKLGHGQFVAKVIGTVMGNQDLQKCSVSSIMQCCLKSAQLGLPVDASGYAYLVPRKDECTYQIGSKGFIELIRRNKDVKSCTVETVYEGDVFEYYIDEQGKHIKHIPNFDAINRENEQGFKCVYAIVAYNNGGSDIEVMGKETVNKIRSCASTRKIWDVWYAEKAKTAVIKRLGKRTSLMNIDTAIEVDDDKPFENQTIKGINIQDNEPAVAEVITADELPDLNNNTQDAMEPSIDSNQVELEM